MDNHVESKKQPEDFPGCTHRCILREDHLEEVGHYYGFKIGVRYAEDFVPEGYAIVKIGEIPPWMQRANLDFDMQIYVDGEPLGDELVYRLSPRSARRSHHD
jgi:hypothetical protein